MFFNHLHDGHLIIRQGAELELGLCLGQELAHDSHHLLELLRLQQNIHNHHLVPLPFCPLLSGDGAGGGGGV